jgi:DNA-binding response OmpR family regulator
MYLSAHSDGAVSPLGMPEMGATFLQKPFSLGALARKVHAALRRTETVR